MHDIKFIRDNPKIFDRKMNNRNVDISNDKKIDDIICIKENTFEKVFVSSEYKIFKNQYYNTDF